MSLLGKTVLITGAARRVGKAMALAAARAGMDVIVHYGHAAAEAAAVVDEIHALGRNAACLAADFNDPNQAAGLIERAWKIQPLDALVNSAAIFEPLDWDQVELDDWERHLKINLTAPFVLIQAFALRLNPDKHGRIVNILDWRALRPGQDHLPYTISKASMAALTRSMAQALAPKITVNAIAFGAILPPSDGVANPHLLDKIPAGRWARLEEVGETMLFLLDGPEYITGEILHLDGGRHLL